MTKQCKYCKKEIRIKPSQLNKKFYCSRSCMANDYRSRFLKEANPNFKDASKKICSRCGTEYKSYNKLSKHCSVECYNTDPSTIQRLRLMAKDANSKVDYSKLRGKRVRHYCRICKQFEVSSKKVQFCNNCRKENRKVKVGRVDLNQKEIVKALEQLGASVYDTSKVGGGFPDLVVAFMGVNYLVEVKNPNNSYGRKGFNQKQKEFSNSWRGGKVHIVRTVDEALRVIGVEV